jgi:hypothetical protein
VTLKLGTAVSEPEVETCDKVVEVLLEYDSRNETMTKPTISITIKIDANVIF